MSSFLDLDYIIPTNLFNFVDLKKTWIYANNLTIGAKIINYLHILISTSGMD